jgi:Subtilase family/Peptidase inhibitor I9
VCLSLLPLSAFAQAELRTVALPLPDHYLVALKPEAARLANESGWQPAVADIAYELDAAQGVEVLQVYRHALRGFAVRATPTALKRMLADPRVEYIEPDALVWLNGMQSRPAVSWGLDRIDQRSPALDGRYSYYRTGAGVNVYVIDSGIYRGHAEFAGRVAQGYSGIADGWGTGDCHGHGTHVSGTIGGASAGVASGVTLHPVRVFGCANSSPVSTVIAGIDWVAAHHQKPAVANLSFSTPFNTSINAAVAAMIASGVAAVVSSGNDTTYDCGYSPSWLPQTLAVSASEEDDSASAYSNDGTCSDIYAPGSNIISASHAHPTALTNMSGTSMATAHVTGVAALHLSDEPTYTPAQLIALIKGTVMPVVRAPGYAGLGGLVYTQGDDLPRYVEQQTRGNLSMIMIERDFLVPEAIHEQVELELPAGWVAVGGGVEVGYSPNGHFITASYPRSDGRAWVVSTREHLMPAPAKIRVWVIGLAVRYYTPAALSNYIHVSRTVSLPGQHPVATAYLPTGYVLLGGGFRTETRGPGMIATGSWPVFPETGPRAPGWSASAKDHVEISPGTVETFAIGIRDFIPSLGRIDSIAHTAVSDIDPNPAGGLMLDLPYVRTGCGAKALWTGAGSLLWRLRPFPNPYTNTQSGCQVGARQHIIPDPSSVQAWAIGIRVY